MPWRFYRYMLFDVLRHFAITGVILVVVIAFGAVIKPLSGDQLLTGFDTIKYLGLAMIPMMQFALPFAAAFASTLGLHRLAQDNEIIAMSVSGQSYAQLLAPMMFFGLTLTLIVAVLTQTVIPKFVGKMADTMTADLPRLLANSIKQHTPFVQGDLVIWAETIRLDTENAGERMVLDKVAVAKLDGSGRAKMVMTAAAALVDIQRNNDQTSLHIETRDTTQWTRGEDGAGILRGAREGRLTHAIDLPALKRQRPSALTLAELLHLREHPLRYPPVAVAKSKLQSKLLKKAYLDSLREKFLPEHIIECTSATGGRRFIIEAAGLNDATFIPPVTVTTIRRTGEANVLVPSKARFVVEQSEDGEIESVTLQMTDIIVGAGQVGENRRRELVVPNLRVQGVEVGTLEALSIAQLLTEADAIDASDITRSATHLRKNLESMEYQIIGRIGQRWAVSALPLLIVLLGSLLAIRYSERSPLAVYAKVFVPAVFALLMIFAGGQMVRDAREVSGFCVMWIGNSAVACLVLFHWMKLRVI